MLLKKIIICPDVGQLCPPLHIHRLFIHIVNPGIPYRQQKRRMRGNHELAAEKPGGILNETHQLLLPLRGQAVFRLIQQIQPILLYFSEK